MADNPDLLLNLPTFEEPLPDSRLAPFDWEAWMQEVEAARQEWVKNYGKTVPQSDPPEPRPSFILE